MRTLNSLCKSVKITLNYHLLSPCSVIIKGDLILTNELYNSPSHSMDLHCLIPPQTNFFLVHGAIPAYPNMENTKKQI